MDNIIHKKTLHVGIVGFCNPAELTTYFPQGTILPNINNNAVSVTTYVKELARSEYELSIFTSFSGEGVRYQEFHTQKIHIYVLSTRHKIRPLGLFSRYYMGKRYSNVIAKHISEIDVLHAQWTYDAALALLPFANKKPCFCTVRDWCPYIKTLAKGWVNKIYWWASYLSFKKVISDKNIHFIANSQYTYERIISARPDVTPDIIPNPIYKDFIIESKPATPTISFVSIASSIDDPRKNNMVLIKAFKLLQKEFPQAMLSFIGGFDECGEIYQYHLQNDLENNVRFTGPIGHDDIFKYVDQSHCLVHPALEETFGNILLEAMARKVVCIGGNESGAVPQVLGYGDCGILCDVTNIDSLLQAMKLSIDKDYVDTLVENATIKINTLYASDVNMSNTIQIYNKHRPL